MTFDSFSKEEYEISIVELGLSDPSTVELDTITAERMSGSSIGDNSTHSKIRRQLKIVTTPLGFMSIVE